MTITAAESRIAAHRFTATRRIERDKSTTSPTTFLTVTDRRWVGGSVGYVYHSPAARIVGGSVGSIQRF